MSVLLTLHLLITTPEGHICLIADLRETVPQIATEHCRILVFGLEDVKILINSHAHLDHAGDCRTQRTKAKLFVSEADATLSNGGKDDFSFKT